MTTGARDSPTGSYPTTVPYDGGLDKPLPQAQLIGGPQSGRASNRRVPEAIRVLGNPQLLSGELPTRPRIPWVTWAIAAAVGLAGIAFGVMDALQESGVLGSFFK